MHGMAHNIIINWAGSEPAGYTILAAINLIIFNIYTALMAFIHGLCYT